MRCPPRTRSPFASASLVTIASALVAATVLTTRALCAGDRPAQKRAPPAVASPSPSAVAASAPPAEPVAPAPVTPPPRIVPPSPRAVDAPDAVTALREALASTDDATRIDAIDAAVKRGATETLPLLEASDLKGDPEAAPATIHAVAALGARARRDERERATDTLSRWLREESSREGVDARGDVSLLVDALGDIGGDGAVDALTSALDDRALPLHVETLAVQRLTELGDPRAAAAVARFASRVAAMPPQPDGLDEELRQEAIAAADAARARLSR